MRRLLGTRISWQILAALANLVLWATIVFLNGVLRQYASWVGAMVACFTASYVGGIAWDRFHPQSKR